jgi:hypothetical protein
MKKDYFKNVLNGLSNSTTKKTNRAEFHHAQELRILDSCTPAYKKISGSIRKHFHPSQRECFSHIERGITALRGFK